jgi:hypothetical protein
MIFGEVFAPIESFKRMRVTIPNEAFNPIKDEP